MNKRKLFPIFLSLSMLITACGTNGEKKGEEPVGSSDEVSEEAEGLGKGHNGDIEAKLSFEGDKIASIELVHKETEGLGDKAADKLVKEIVDNQSINVDSVSGATETSTAIIVAVKEAIEASGRDISLYEKEVAKKDGESKTIDTDVVVVGGGGAGFAAAVSAKEAGVDVILLEKLDQVGGNTLISGGEYAAPANDLQEKEGIEDSKELFAKDVEVAGGNKDLIAVLADKATEACLLAKG